MVLRFHPLQLASNEVVTIGISVTKNEIPIFDSKPSQSALVSRTDVYTLEKHGKSARSV